MYDITADGVADVLIGRDDGLVEVFGFDEMEEPVQRYSQVCTSNNVMHIVVILSIVEAVWKI